MEILAPEDQPITHRDMITILQQIQPPPQPQTQSLLWIIPFTLIAIVLIGGMLVGFAMLQPKPDPTATPAPTWTPTFTPTFTATVTHTPTATPIPKYKVVRDYYDALRVGDYVTAWKCLSKQFRNRVGQPDDLMHKAIETGPITAARIIPEEEDSLNSQVLVQLYFADEQRYRWYRFILVYDSYVKRWQIAGIQNYSAWATPEG